MTRLSPAFLRTIALASLLATVGIAQAQSAGYLQLGLGRSDLNLDCEGTTSCDTTDSAFQLIGGWRFGSGVAAEAMYVNFGKATASVGAARAEGKATLLGVGGAFIGDFGNGFGGVARLGIGRASGKVTASGPGGSISDSDNATGVYAGLGLTYAFTKGVVGELGYLRARAKFDGDSGTVSAVTLGVRFDF